MRNYLIGTSILLSSFVAPSFAEESKEIYLSIGGGIAFPSDVNGDSTLNGTNYDATFSTDSTSLFSVAVGKEFNEYRLELQYGSATVDSDKITVESGGVGVTASMIPNLESKVKSYMIYGLKEFDNETKLTPYAGIGLGFASLSADDQTVTIAGTEYSVKGADKSVFSFALRGGVEYEVTEATSLYSDATYQNFASYKVSEPGYETVNYDSNSFFAVTAGLKFNF
tara:strand:+ start:393 stop:1067 length:675 start_codon:yes stop_codon:yes gene_type:complete